MDFGFQFSFIDRQAFQKLLHACGLKRVVGRLGTGIDFGYRLTGREARHFSNSLSL